MAQVSPVSITNSTVQIATINNNQKASIVTHDLSPFIANNPTKEFTIFPAHVENTLIIVLDGLILKPTKDNIPGDYTLNGNVITLNVNILESNANLLAIYQEA